MPRLVGAPALELRGMAVSDGISTSNGRPWPIISEYRPRVRRVNLTYPADSQEPLSAAWVLQETAA